MFYYADFDFFYINKMKVYLSYKIYTCSLDGFTCFAMS